MISEVTSTKDYRNTSYKYSDFTLGDKKENFMKGFRKVHIRAWNIYSNIKSRQSGFNRAFKAIYHDKCVYCGINTHVIELSRFEIDHFIPQAVLEKGLGYSTEDINGIYNLVNSCNMCNRKKSSFITDRDNFQLLHPDKEDLIKIFDRLDDFSIVINNDYINNNEVVKFYETLNLDNQIRRLDFLIMEMKDFCEQYPMESIVPQINALILKIESKRRKNY
jgi:hypothetical protein